MYKHVKAVNPFPWCSFYRLNTPYHWWNASSSRHKENNEEKQYPVMTCIPHIDYNDYVDQEFHIRILQKINYK